MPKGEGKQSSLASQEVIESCHVCSIVFFSPPSLLSASRREGKKKPTTKVFGLALEEVDEWQLEREGERSPRGAEYSSWDFQHQTVVPTSSAAKFSTTKIRSRLPPLLSFSAPKCDSSFLPYSVFQHQNMLPFPFAGEYSSTKLGSNLPSLLSFPALKYAPIFLSW